MIEQLRKLAGKLKSNVVGELIRGDKVVIDRGHTTLRINLRKKEKTGELFVGLALFASGSSSYHLLEGREIDEFAKIVAETKIIIDEANGISDRPDHTGPWPPLRPNPEPGGRSKI